MMHGKYLITGRPGSGKTTICEILQKAGYVAYDIDYTNGLAKFHDKSTGEQYSFAELCEKPFDSEKYTYEVQIDKLKELLESNKLVFICGKAHNLEELYSLFDIVFVLVVDTRTVKERLVLHRNKTRQIDSQKERLLANFEKKQHLLLSSGDNTMAINANRVPQEIVEDIFLKVRI